MLWMILINKAAKNQFAVCMSKVRWAHDTLTLVDKFVLRDGLLVVVFPGGKIWVCVCIEISIRISATAKSKYNNSILVDVSRCWEIRRVTANILRASRLINSDVVNAHFSREL